MSTWRWPDGAELVICDGCGVDYTGRKLSLAGAVRVDHTKAMLAEGFPTGTRLDVTDTCPECATKGEPRKPGGRHP